MGCFSSKHVRSASFYMRKYPTCKNLEQQPHVLISAIVELVNQPSKCTIMKTYKRQNTWHSEWVEHLQFGVVHIVVRISVRDNLSPEHLSIHIQCESPHVVIGLRNLIELNINRKLNCLNPPWRQDTYVNDAYLTFTREI